MVFWYNLFKRIKELERENKTHKNEIDSLMSQLEESHVTVSVLERWLSDVKRDKDELKDHLYEVSGIVRKRTNDSKAQLEKLPIGTIRMSSVLHQLEERQRNLSKPISKESIEEIEKEVELNANKVS